MRSWFIIYFWITVIFIYFIPVNTYGRVYINTPKDTTIIICGIPVDISYPEGKVNGTILMLPGWNFSRNDCCDKSSFCDKALSKGYCLIKPEMGKSVYHSRIYKETHKEWKKFPTRIILTDSIIPFIQDHFYLLKNGQKNYLYGISTGARGVALLAIYTKNIFVACACLSGDYDQTKMPKDNLMKEYYGDFTKFPDRWKGVDNPLLNASKIKIPLYISHGKKDKVVPYNQSEIFYKDLVKYNSNLKHSLFIDDKAEHNYNFWDSRTEDILMFFSRF
ncbi:MAG: prolyl oligopeptidase family serine peptidase [Bacteroidota bacterium]|nr:prolyl oligopeptidase family serine peptidase [Bacteroidota bacterium]